MREIWLMAVFIIKQNLRRRSFLFTMFGVPLLTVVMMAFVAFLSVAALDSGEVSGERIGYYDASGILEDGISRPDNYIVYDDAETGRAALDAQEVDVFISIPPTYVQLGQMTVYSYGTIPESLTDDFESYLIENISAQMETRVPLDRLTEPTNMIFRFNDSGRQIDGTEGALGLILVPGMLSFLFMFTLQISSTALMTSVVEEKSGRILEILVTSVTPFQMLTGKLLGLGLVGLMQLFLWFAIGGIGLLVFGDRVEFLQAVVIPADLLILALVYFVLSYFMFASLFAGVGAVLGSEQEARQYAGVISLLPVVPFFFFASYIIDANGTLPVALSIIPFTSAIGMVMRVALTAVPLWQIGLSLALLVVTSLFIIWLSAKVFRWALLLYGKRPNLRTLWHVMRGNADMGTVVAASKES